MTVMNKITKIIRPLNSQSLNNCVCWKNVYRHEQYRIKKTEVLIVVLYDQLNNQCVYGSALLDKLFLLSQGSVHFFSYLFHEVAIVSTTNTCPNWLQLLNVRLWDHRRPEHRKQPVYRDLRLTSGIFYNWFWRDFQHVDSAFYPHWIIFLPRVFWLHPNLLKERRNLIFC